MVKYAYKSDSTCVGKSRYDDAKVSFKNTYETCRAIKGMQVTKAQAYLSDVIEHKNIIPFFRFTGGVGRHAQAKKFGTSQGRWPEKSVRLVQEILKQATNNAIHQHNKKEEELHVISICVNRAHGRHRRMFRAHGRITKFDAQPCHVEIIVGPKAQDVPKALK
ncbi:Ribosomal protein L17 [Giardia muris]|uniref:Ribosomal protein L17 n=1 Tax=Giardia muris TaxID=5742 RepID=A0A4Z1T735_GIAMU|nr:Ribosomal protein L17 [Giardia muris]|eukprot:TNJ28311.1 Ribosomal protein L17 [Giardia muris]